MNKITTGTRELSDISLNIQKGCTNGCVYCYACYNALRWQHIAEPEEWAEPVYYRDKINKDYRLRKGKVIMFPTTHDITPMNITKVMIVLHKVLAAGNKVLITTKPNFQCVVTMVREFINYKDQIEFLFTIGSIHDSRIRDFESNSPDIADRMDSLTLAFKQGYNTSVIIEPWLDTPVSLVSLIQKVQDSVNRNIWIGPCNPRYKGKDWWDESLWGKEAIRLTDIAIQEEISAGTITKILYKDNFVKQLDRKNKTLSQYL